MNLYIISGLGADAKVFSRIKFNENIKPIYIDWLIPEREEDFYHYIGRMAEKIDTSEPFCLLGYSFGGIVAQEINKLKPAEKVVILGSIRSDKEKSKLIKAGMLTKIPKLLPESAFGEKAILTYSYLRKMIEPKNPKLLEYFRVRNAYYLKWSMEKITEWQSEETQGVVQIMGDKDIVFPLKNCSPDYIIRNGTHLFPLTHSAEVSRILREVLSP